MVDGILEQAEEAIRLAEEAELEPAPWTGSVEIT